MAAVSCIARFLKYLKNKNLGVWDAFKVSFLNGVCKRPVTIMPLIVGHPISLRGGKSSDLEVFDEICVFREYDIKLETTPGLIIDAGANCGISTVFFAKKYPFAKVISIEPHPANIEAIKRNTAGLSNIELIPRALYSHKCTLYLENALDAQEWEYRFSEGGSRQGGTETVTVMELLEANPGLEVDVLKLDIEGAEWELFGDGCSEWIGQVKVLIIELHDWIRKGTAERFFGVISKLGGYTFSIRGESVVIRFRNDREMDRVD